MIEPGVRVEKIRLTGNTPAIRLFPVTPGPHPIALLAHGATGSKENLFRFGEALAAAGFDSYSVDQPGHGESPHPLFSTNLIFNIQQFERAHGAVDVFVGHSFGGWVGAWSVHNAGFRPKLFIGIGADAELAKDGPPVLMLFGRFDYFGLQAPTNAQVVISPWSEHILEFADPVLVNAAVKAACATVGKPVPAAQTPGTNSKVHCSRRSTHRHRSDDGHMDHRDPAVAPHSRAACFTACHLAGARRPKQAAAATMESGGGVRVTGACLPGT